MHKRRLLGWIALLVSVSAPRSAALAQGSYDLDRTYETDDGSFTFAYPHVWQLEVVENDIVYLTNFGEGFTAYIYPPRPSLGVTAAYLASQFVQGQATTEVGDASPVQVGSYEGTQLTFVTDRSIEGYVLIVMLPNNTFASLLVYWTIGYTAVWDETLLAIAETFTFESPAATTTLPAELAHMGDPWQEVVEELEATGLIGSGGSLVFQEDRVFLDGESSRYTSLTQNRSAANFVMAGRLDFVPDTMPGMDLNTEMCVMLSRLTADVSTFTGQVVAVGLTGRGFPFAGDFSSVVDLEGLEIANTPVSLESPIDLLLIAKGSQLTVYINNALFFEQVVIQDRSGTFGVALGSQSERSVCEFSDIWAYEVPFVEPGVCEVRVTGSVNWRSGPGTDNPVAGQVTPGENPRVTGQAADSAGFTWWQLEGGGWVRDDVVTAAGDCRDVPVVTP